MVGAGVTRGSSLGLVVALSLGGCLSDDQVLTVPPNAAGVGGVTGGSGTTAVGGTALGGSASGGGGLAGRGGSPSLAPVIEHPFAIELDYRMDRVGFFSEPNRRSALEAAAKLWADEISWRLLEVPAGAVITLPDLEKLDDTLVEYTLEAPLTTIMVFVACSPVLDVAGVAGRTKGSSIAYPPGSPGFLVAGPVRSPYAVGIAFACERTFFADPTPATDTDLPIDQTDLMSMAAHELGHALGIGASPRFFELVNVEGEQSFFVGEQSVSLYGAPLLLDDGLRHLSSTVTWEGRPVAMDPSLTVGTRVRPTPIDFALLEDIGTESTPPP
jgi:hypothetical protein